jgi:hypothetical protein
VSWTASPCAARADASMPVPRIFNDIDSDNRRRWQWRGVAVGRVPGLVGSTSDRSRMPSIRSAAGGDAPGACDMRGLYYAAPTPQALATGQAQVRSKLTLRCWRYRRVIRLLPRDRFLSEALLGAARHARSCASGHECPPTAPVNSTPTMRRAATPVIDSIRRESPQA